MATKPTEVPSWAVNTTYTVGPDIGSATKLAPPASSEENGHVPGVLNPPIAQHENWRQNKIGEWLEWTNEITAYAEFEFPQLATPSGTDFDLVELSQSGGFQLLNSTSIQVPTAGVYEINLGLTVSTTISNAHAIAIELEGLLWFSIQISTLDQSVVEEPSFSFSGLIVINTPATERISIENQGQSDQTPALNSRQISIRRIF